MPITGLPRPRPLLRQVKNSKLTSLSMPNLLTTHQQFGEGGASMDGCHHFLHNCDETSFVVEDNTLLTWLSFPLLNAVEFSVGQGNPKLTRIDLSYTHATRSGYMQRYYCEYLPPCESDDCSLDGTSHNACRIRGACGACGSS